ncbi:hypothetical protein [Bacillus phage vB_BanS-Thrax5]|nr:hypothetical protein [Bacillus phage vB_BanS-Thrax5]
MIHDLKFIHEDSQYKFESELKRVVERFQSAGLIAEIQLSVNTRENNPYTHFSALIVGKENPVNKG